ncbi:DUF397 domain-containing protein [Streptomyces sp. CWNU-52B]|uniref:DUF397 domain-containing protein n=1 Tax=unclassified Streptomyces TaxID=2593676 RepID=UPI0039C4C469
MTTVGLWQKSSFSGPEDAPNCVEVATGSRTLLLRESDDPDHVIAAGGTALAALIRHLRR